MTQYFIIKEKLPAFNEYQNMARANKYGHAAWKKKLTESIAQQIRAAGITPVRSAHLTFIWIEKDKRRDKDNISFARKFILDALVLAGVLKNDGWAEVKGFAEEFSAEGRNEVVVILES